MMACSGRVCKQLDFWSKLDDYSHATEFYFMNTNNPDDWHCPTCQSLLREGGRGKDFKMTIKHFVIPNPVKPKRCHIWNTDTRAVERAEMCRDCISAYYLGHQKTKGEITVVYACPMLGMGKIMPKPADKNK